MNIAIVGTGKVACFFANQFIKTNHKIVAFVGRNEYNTTTLAQKYKALAIKSIQQIPSNTDVVLIAITDAAIIEVVKEVSCPNVIIAHTAGGVHKNVLQNSSKNYGVFYPLQSITSSSKSLEYPIIIDGSNAFTLQSLEILAKSISNNVVVGDDAYRNKLHLAAVITNNFSNYLYALAEDFCKEEEVEFKLLLPLIQETVNRLQTQSPKDSFTGPAVRNDVATIQKHVKMLDSHPNIKPIYEFLTAELIKYHHK